MIGAGCGSGGSAGISRAQFVNHANAICKGTSARIQSELAAYGRSPEGRRAVREEKAGELSFSEAAVRVARRILIPAMRRQLEELHALGIPKGDGGGATALLDAFDEGIEKAGRRPERAVQDGTEAFGKQERLAGEYGIESC
jgi:hypothetical protein